MAGIAAAAALLLAPASAPAANLSSTFDTSAEGWLVYGNNLSDLSGGTAPTHSTTGGNPGGQITVTDAVDDSFLEWVLVSPPAWSGDRRSSYGGTLSLDMKTQSADTSDVALEGGGLCLWHSLGFGPGGSAWASRAVALDSADAGWQVGFQNMGISCDPPDRDAETSDFQIVLASLDAVEISADPFAAPTVSFDNIKLTEPTTPPDHDGDGVADINDNCPTGASAGADTDGDGCKDAGEDSDDDNDTVADGSDNCPNNSNAGQQDSDSDGVGDACDPTPLPPTPPSPPPADDTAPPDTTITGGPKSKTKKTTASFSFTSTEPASTFECSLNGATFAPCTSPLAVKGKKGKNSFAVRAKDAAGNVDPTPATDDWKVKKKK
jgi:hypothetical protein